jgi:ATP adenylyltransferase
VGTTNIREKLTFPKDTYTAPKIPFGHAVKRLPATPNPFQLSQTYETLLNMAKVNRAAGHNVLITDEWMLVTPRSKGRKGILSANAAAMAGMVWVTGEEEVKQWVEQGPMRLLCEFGVVDEAVTLDTVH